MLKKLLIAVGAVIAGIVVLVIVAGVIVYITVDKAFVSAQMTKVLNRQVSIEKVDANIFAALSGIEVQKVAVSNFKTPQELEALQGKPVPVGDIFADVETLRVKVKFWPLLKRQVELKELILYSPVINLSRNKQGVLNIDDLIKPKKQPTDKKEPQTKEPAKPFTADDIPVAVAVGVMGIKNGTINYYDGEYDQKFQIYKLTTFASDIGIDPKELEKKDEIKLELGMGIKTVGAMKTGSVQSFDLTINAAGKVIPFDVKTRQFEPEVVLHVAVPDGRITGLQIFNAVAAMPVLGDYLGQHISFLKGKPEWKGSKETGVDVRYKAPRLDMASGKLDLKEAKLRFDGSMNVDTKAIDLNLEMLMNKEINDSLASALAQKIGGNLKNPDIKKYADPDTLARLAMQPLLNKDGVIDLQVKVEGSVKKADVKLVKPQLGSLSNIGKISVGGITVEAGKDAVKKFLNEDQQKVLEGLGDFLKKK